MNLEPFADHPLPQRTARDPHLRSLEDALDRAYDDARRGGYRRGSPEMEALRRAETRYQQAKNG
jgi:hypothetical protein